jgi:hypothetical protein
VCSPKLAIPLDRKAVKPKHSKVDHEDDDSGKHSWRRQGVMGCSISLLDGAIVYFISKLLTGLV